MKYRSATLAAILVGALTVEACGAPPPPVTGPAAFTITVPAAGTNPTRPTTPTDDPASPVAIPQATTTPTPNGTTPDDDPAPTDGPTEPTAGTASAGTGDATADPAVGQPGTDAVGTIVYEQDNNIWIARGDGSGAHQVTTDGTPDQPYHSPSESDGGIIAAAHDTLIVRMDQRGQILNQIDPPPLPDSAGQSMDGPVNDVALSPDGATIAYSYIRSSCPVGADCLTRYATGYTTADHPSPTGQSTYYRAPSWIGNHRTLQTGGYRSQVMLQDLDAVPVHWFDDSDYATPDQDLADGDLSPDGRWLAEVRGDKDAAAIIWYRVTGDPTAGNPPPTPTYTCNTNGQADHSSPTWSPDSTALAWSDTSGIWIKHRPDRCTTEPATLLLPHAAHPDWSPASLT